MFAVEKIRGFLFRAREAEKSPERARAEGPHRLRDKLPARHSGAVGLERSRGYFQIGGVGGDRWLCVDPKPVLWSLWKKLEGAPRAHCGAPFAELDSLIGKCRQVAERAEPPSAGCTMYVLFSSPGAIYTSMLRVSTQPAPQAAGAHKKVVLLLLSPLSSLPLDRRVFAYRRLVFVSCFYLTREVVGYRAHFRNGRSFSVS